MKRFSFSFAVFIALMVLTSACATNIKIHVPYAALEAPDVSGSSGKMHFGLNATPGKDINLIENAASRPPVFNQQYKTTGLDPAVFAGVGIFRTIDLTAQYGFGGIPLAKLKWQILGSGMTEAADNDLLFAVYGRAGYSEDGEDGDQTTTFGDGGYPWKGKGKIGITGGGASLGYRFPEAFMVYLGYAYDHYEGKATVSQAVSATGNSAGGEYSVSHRGHSRAAGIGFKWGRETNFTIYAQGTEFRWDGLASYEDIQGGIQFTVAIK